MRYHVENKMSKQDENLRGQILVQHSGLSALLDYHAQRAFTQIPVRVVKKIRKEILGHNDVGEEEGTAEDDDVEAPDAEKAVDHTWHAVMGALKCSETSAATILEKSLGMRTSRDYEMELLQCEEVTDAMNRDEHLEAEKFLEGVAIEEKATFFQI
ncbi:unnamed protein product [Symbiodinium sp. CCMP2592]|nr:unnamed protein product [Symbiodinium sp. CCMP2592]CAE7488266.1 unnamed protein product [Symbiodinium sp. CCMP2592]